MPRHESSPGDASSPFEWIDLVADRFEAAWREGARPGIETYLAEAGEPHRAELLRELIQLDVAYRRRAGEEPALEDYVHRFPELEGQWPRTILGEDEGAGASGSALESLGAGAEFALPSACAGPVRCPHCHNLIRLVDQFFDEVVCPGCGSSFPVRQSQLKSTMPYGRHLGKFALLDRIGRGAFGEVWRAKDRQLRRVVALKIPHAGLFDSAANQERFLREARVAAQLRHPGIVTVHEVTDLGGIPVIVSDFIDGVSLSNLLDVRRLTYVETAQLVAQIAEAIDYAHSMGAIHRDIKPSNVMVERLHGPRGHAGVQEAGPSARTVGKPVVMDFGLALRQEAEITMTVDGQILGTPAYMSPEQAAGRSHEADGRTDVYSLGAVMYQMLTGQLPFRGSKMMLVHQVLEEEPRLPRRINHTIPRDLETICLKAMAKAPARRYQTARALADDLRRWLSGEPIRARPIGAAERLLRWCRRNPVVTGLLILLVAVFSAGFAGVVWQWQRASAAAIIARRNEKKAQDEKQRAEDAKQQSEGYLQDLTQTTTSFDETKEILHRYVYNANLNLAQQSWNRARVRKVLDLLRVHQPKNGSRDLRGFEWFYLWKLAHGDKATFRGHSSGIHAVAFSPDGTRLATAGQDNTVRIWDVTSGRTLAVLRGHSDEVNCVKFAPGGATIASASDDRTALLWKVASGEKRQELQAERPVKSLSFDPRGEVLVTAGGSAEAGEVKVWRIIDDIAVEKATLPGLEAAVTEVAFSPDGKMLATAAGQGPGSAGGPAQVTLWDAATFGRRGTFQAETDRLLAILFTPDGETLITGGIERDGSGSVKLRDVAGGETKSALDVGRTFVLSLALSPNARTLAVGTLREVTLWDLAAKTRKKTFAAHSGLIYAMDFAADGKTLATAAISGDTTAKLWDIGKAPNPRALTGHTGWVSSVAFSPDGRHVATANRTLTPEGSAQIILWDPTTGAARKIIPGGTRDIYGLAFAPDGQLLAAACGDATVKLWDPRSGHLLDTLRGHEIPVTHVAFSKDGTTLVSADGQYHRVAPDGKYFDTDGRPGQVKLWALAKRKAGATHVAASLRDAEPQTVAERKVSAALEGHTDAVSALAYSPDGTLLATGCRDGVVRLWGAADATLRRSIPSHSKAVTALAFAPDGRTLAVAGIEGGPDESGVIKLYDTQSWTDLATLVGHDASISTISYSPDGRTLATASWDGTIRLWDNVFGLERFVLRGQQVNAIAFSPDGRTLVSGGTDKNVRIYQAATDQEVSTRGE